VFPIDTGTLDNNDIRVIGPNGFNVLATLVTFNASNPNSVVAAYSFVAAANPTPGWDAGDNGTYSVLMESSQVADINSLFVPSGGLGQFNVAIPVNFVVTNLNDSGPGSLRQAILNANVDDNSDLITFQPGLTGTITLNSGELLISRPVSIVGPGPSVLTVSGGGASRIFDISENGPTFTVSIAGLTVTGGNGSPGGGMPANNGGGIFAFAAFLTLDNVRITGNTSPFGGGGVCAARGGLVVRNSTISDNILGSGNVFANGGGIEFFEGGSLTLENCTVSGNTATGPEGGGGVYFEGPAYYSGVAIRNCTITGNSATSGGGVCFSALGTDNAQVLIQNCTITNNLSTTTDTTSGSGGGGVAFTSVFTFSSGVVSLVSSIVSGNTSNLVNGRDDIAVVSNALLNANYCAIGDPDGFSLSGSSGNNLPFGAALNLQPPGANGGPTQTIALGNGSLAIDAGPMTVPGVPFDQRGSGFPRINGPRADIGAYESQAPRVTSIAVNGGATQRSRVTTLAVTFSTQVTFAGPVASAFSLVRNGGGAVTFSATANLVGGVTVVTIDNFTGAEAQFGSLSDGRYTLTVLANQISAGGINMPSNVTFGSLFRFFGDVNGDATVNGFDLGFFRNAFGAQTGDSNYLSFLDFNGDGAINGFDLGQFRTRFGTTLP
jgi:hypothetical protein